MWTPSNGNALGPYTEWSGPTVANTTLKINNSTHTPYVELSFNHADGLALLPAQGCFHCCNQTSPPPAKAVGAGEWLFEVANHAGNWLPAVGSAVAGLGRVRVTPMTTVPCKSPGACWLAGVRYAVIDVPQCALYNTASLPASQFELPVPWASSSL